MSAGPRSVAGSVNACLAIRRAVTPLQVMAVGEEDFAVINSHFARS
jgi:hypothetical protein